MTPREIERTLLRFEGLVYETARQIVATGVELEFDDVRQLLRVKVWQAVLKHDATHRRSLPLRRYVFMCVANARKDLEKRPRRYNSSIEEIRDSESTAIGSDHHNRRDWFDARYLSVDAERVFSQVEDEFELPSTLTAAERQVLKLRLDGHLLHEIDRQLGLSRAQRERVMHSLRAKLADWKPTSRAPAPSATRERVLEAIAA